MKRVFLFSVCIVVAMNLIAQMNLTTKSKKAIELFRDEKYSNSFDERETLLLDAIKKDKYFIKAYWVLADVYNKREKVQQAAD